MKKVIAAARVLDESLAGSVPGLLSQMARLAKLVEPDSSAELAGEIVGLASQAIADLGEEPPVTALVMARVRRSSALLDAGRADDAKTELDAAAAALDAPGEPSWLRTRVRADVLDAFLRAGRRQDAAKQLERLDAERPPFEEEDDEPGRIERVLLVEHVRLDDREGAKKILASASDEVRHEILQGLGDELSVLTPAEGFDWTPLVEVLAEDAAGEFIPEGRASRLTAIARAALSVTKPADGARIAAAALDGVKESIDDADAIAMVAVDAAEVAARIKRLDDAVTLLELAGSDAEPGFVLARELSRAGDPWRAKIVARAGESETRSELLLEIAAGDLDRGDAAAAKKLVDEVASGTLDAEWGTVATLRARMNDAAGAAAAIDEHLADWEFDLSDPMAAMKLEIVARGALDAKRAEFAETLLAESLERLARLPRQQQNLAAFLGIAIVGVAVDLAKP